MTIIGYDNKEHHRRFRNTGSWECKTTTRGIQRWSGRTFWTQSTTRRTCKNMSDQGEFTSPEVGLQTICFQATPSHGDIQDNRTIQGGGGRDNHVWGKVSLTGKRVPLDLGQQWQLSRSIGGLGWRNVSYQGAATEPEGLPLEKLFQVTPPGWRPLGQNYFLPWSNGTKIFWGQGWRRGGLCWPRGQIQTQRGDPWNIFEGGHTQAGTNLEEGITLHGAAVVPSRMTRGGGGEDSVRPMGLQGEPSVHTPPGWDWYLPWGSKSTYTNK